MTIMAASQKGEELFVQQLVQTALGKYPNIVLISVSVWFDEPWVHTLFFSKSE